VVEASRNTEQAAVEVLGTRHVNSEVGKFRKVQGVCNKCHRRGIDDHVIKTALRLFYEFSQTLSQQQLRWVWRNISRQNVLHVGVARVLNKEVVESEAFVDDVIGYPSLRSDVEVASNFGSAEV